MGSALVPGFNFQAEAQWRGFYHEDGWVLINVAITNPGASFAAQLSVNPPLGYETRRTEFSRHVNIAAGVTSHFQLYVCLIQLVQSLSLSLVDGQGQNISQTVVRVSPVDYGTYMLGVVGTNPPVATPGVTVTPLLFDSRKRVFTTSFNSTQLPDRPEGLSVFNAIALQDLEPSQLSPAQSSALLNWTLAGGRLIVAPQNQNSWSKLQTWLNTLTLPAVLNNKSSSLNLEAPLSLYDPLDPASATKLSLSNLPATVQLLNLELKPQSQDQLILDLKQADQPLQPLVLAARVGQGVLVVSALDPFQPALAASDLLWNSLLNSLGPIKTYDPPNDSVLTNRDLATAVLAMGTIGTDGQGFNWLFLVLIFLYLVILLPVSYLGWRKLHRPELILLSVPLSAILITVGLVLVSPNQRFVASQRFDVVQFANQTGPTNAWISSYLVLQVGSDSGCQLTFKDEQVLLRPTIFDVDALKESGETDTNGFVYSPQFQTQQPASANCEGHGDDSLKILTFEDWLQLTPPLVGTLQFNGQQITGKLTNQTNYTLENAALVFGESYQKLGVWKPEQQLDINFRLETSPDTLPNPNGAISTFLNSFTSPISDQNLYFTALNSLSHAGRFGSAVQLDSVYLVGLVHNFVGKQVLLNQDSSHSQDLALVIQALPFKLVPQSDVLTGAAVYQVPTQFFMPTLLQNDASTVIGGDLLTNGTQIREYRLPPVVPSEAQPQTLNINLVSYYLSSLGARSVPNVPEISVYNWKTQQWRVIASEDLAVNNVQVALGADELEPQTHAFRLRLKAARREHLIQKFNVSLTMK
jgi:hypothetical protein